MKLEMKVKMKGRERRVDWRAGKEGGVEYVGVEDCDLREYTGAVERIKEYVGRVDEVVIIDDYRGMLEEVVRG